MHRVRRTDTFDMCLRTPVQLCRGLALSLMLAAICACQSDTRSEVEDSVASLPAALRWCRSGFELKHGRCVNIDECKTGQARCEAACVDTQGSYRCECGAGGALAPDGKHCNRWRAPVKLEQDDIGNAEAPQVAADRGGNALAVWQQSDGTRSSVWSSRLDAASGSWSRAQLLEHDDRGDATAPQVALAGNGSGLAVWEQSDGVHFNVWTARFDSTTRTWSSAALLEQDDAGDARAAQVCAASSGDAVVVWQQSSDIWGAQYNAASASWSAPQRVDGHDRGAAQSPRVACDAHGHAIAVWEQADGTRSEVWANRLAAVSGQWTGAVRLEEYAAGSTSAPALAVDQDGDAVALWKRTTPAPDYETVIRASHFSAATTAWGDAVTLSSGAGLITPPQVAFGGGDRAVAVWEQSDETGSWIRAASFADQTWGAARPLITPESGGAGHPQVAIGPDGAAVAVWDHFVVNPQAHWHYQIWAARMAPDADVFSTPTQLEPDDSGITSWAAVAMDGRGGAIALWSGARKNIRSSRLDPSTLGWSSPLQLESDDTGNAEQPRIAVRPQGDAIVVFAQDDGTRRNVWSNTYDVAARRWRGPAALTKENTGSSATAAVALNPAGDAVAIWVRGNFIAERTEIWTSRLQLKAAAWTQPVELETGVLSNGTHDPQIALSDAGAGLAVWRDYSAQYKARVWASWTRPPTHTWSDAFLLDQDAQHSAAVARIAITPGGDAIAVWTQTDGTHQNLWANRYQIASDSWSGPEKLETDDTADVLVPSLALNGSGDAIVVWQQAQGGLDQVWANRFSRADARWLGATALQPSAAGAGRAPHVALDAQGAAIAVWQRSSAGSDHVWSARAAPGSSSWETARRIDRDAAPAGSVRVALGVDGSAHAVWLQRSGSFQHVSSSHLASGASSWSPPVSLEQDDIADSSAPELVLDAQGRATAVWSGSRLNVWAARYE